MEDNNTIVFVIDEMGIGKIIIKKINFKEQNH